MSIVYVSRVSDRAAKKHIFVRSSKFPDVFVPMFEENMENRYT